MRTWEIIGSKFFFLLSRLLLTGILLFLLIFEGQSQRIIPAPYGNSVQPNSLRIWDAKKRTLDANSITLNSSTADYQMVSQFSDGLGRPIQKVIKGGSLTSTSLQNDVVEPNIYDETGMETVKYLPFAATTNDGNFKRDPFQQQANFYVNPNGIISGQETYFYSQTTLEASPLQRVLQTFDPGNNWVGSNKGPSFQYDNNLQSENVHSWQMGASENDIPITGISVYQDNQLYKNTIIDENNKLIITYTDFSGHVILKKVQILETNIGLTNQHGGWLCTYYIYDDMGRQRFIIPPKAVAFLDVNNWVLTDNIIKELCFSDFYDKRGRLVVKKSPGADPVYIVYDSRDRVVFTQDGNQRRLSSKNWKVTLYDNLSRTTVSGLMDYSGDRLSLQSWMDNVMNNGGNDLSVINTSTAPFINLSINSRDPLIHTYTASNSIIFNPGFASDDGGFFETKIDPTAQTTVNSVNVNGNPLPSGNNLYTLSLSFYDDYSYPGAKTFSTNFTVDNSLASNESEVVTSSILTRGLLTGTKIRVLDGSNNFLTTTSFYDDKGRMIQVVGDNHKGFVNEATTQYDFNNKIRSNCTITRFDDIAGLKVFTKNTYDILGRFTSISKTINNGTEKIITNYLYNEIGALSKKILAPAFTGDDGPQLETLNYSYNIHGSLTGINKDYASSTIREGNYFGMELGYDKASNPGFVNPAMNGNISGNAWKTRGDNKPRKFDYTYDNTNQLLLASFNQRNSYAASWTIDKMNFSSNYTYDENGNIKSQNQWGVAPGKTPEQIDQLSYNYNSFASSNPWTNKLQNVAESALGSSGSLGDFKNGTAAPNSPQYDYDNNGNLIKDLNKQVGDAASSGITYNYMDLPLSVTFKSNNKSISYVYDAGGNKLRKILDDPGGSGLASRHIETDYLDNFVYENNQLQFFFHEEGRVRSIKSYGNPGDANYDGGGILLSNGQQLVYDYFIKDHLSNIRMILTEEIKNNSDRCTMETNDANIKMNEETNFGQNGSANEVSATRALKPTDPCGSSNPQGWVSNTSSQVSKLSGLTNKIGPNRMLKVMSGDVVSAIADYYFKNNNNQVSNPNLLNDIASSIFGLITSERTNSNIKGNSSLIQTNINNGSINPFLNSERPVENSTSPPKAYLNIIYFDEQFNFIEGAFQRVSVSCDNTDHLVVSKEAKQNGWAYVYLSNESDEPVYFDNLQVNYKAGRIVEENHFYTYGLKINALSTHSQGMIDNKFGYQGDYAENDAETSLDEFELRHYDPQLGRWTTIDPNDQFANPYLGMGNSPANSVDPDGGSSLDYFKGVNSGSILWATSTASSIMDGGEKFLNIGKEYWEADGGGWMHYFEKGKSEFFSNNEKNLIAFSRGFIDGVNTGMNFINHSINPAYLFSNGVISQFTQKDMLDGTRMSHSQGLLDILLIAAPEIKIEVAGERVAIQSSKALGQDFKPEIVSGVQLVENVPNISYNTKAGNYPSWAAVKKRYWKLANNGVVPQREAIVNLIGSRTNVQRLISKELHHINGRVIEDPHNYKNLIELWPWEHEAVDASRKTGYNFIDWIK